MEEKLTIQQQQLVEENHNLIYEFAYRKNLLLDEYYDILAIGLCNAAKIYNDNKGSFSTIANCCMRNEVDMYWRSLERKKRKSNVPKEMHWSLDEYGNDINALDYLYVGVSHDPTYENVYNEMLVEGLNDILTDKEKLIVEYLMNGLYQTEIGRILNCKQQTIHYHIKKIGNKISRYLNYNN